MANIGSIERFGIETVATNEHKDTVVRDLMSRQLWCNPWNESDSDDFYGSWYVESVEQAWKLCDMLRKHKAEIKSLGLPKI